MNSVLIKVAYFLEQPYSRTKPSLLCPQLSAWPSFHVSRWFGLIAKSINQPKNEFPHFTLLDERQEDDKIGQLPPSDVLMWTFSGECLVFGERLWTSVCRWPTHCIPDRPFCLDWTRNGAVPGFMALQGHMELRLPLKKHPQDPVRVTAVFPKALEQVREHQVIPSSCVWSCASSCCLKKQMFIVWLFKHKGWWKQSHSHKIL